MILKVRLDSGAEQRVPISYAHIKDGCLLYKHANGEYQAGVVDLNRTLLVEFEGDDSEPDSSSAGTLRSIEQSAC